MFDVEETHDGYVRVTLGDDTEALTVEVSRDEALLFAIQLIVGSTPLSRSEVMGAFAKRPTSEGISAKESSPDTEG